MHRVLLLVAFVAAVARPVEAVPLADRVPSSVIVFASWAGTDAIEASYGQTHTKALLDASESPAFLEEVLPKAIATLAREEEDFAPVADVFKTAGPILWRRPTAVAFGGMDWNSPLNNGREMPRLMFVCDAGEDLPTLRAAIAQAAGRAGGRSS